MALKFDSESMEEVFSTFRELYEEKKDLSKFLCQKYQKSLVFT
jgi:hypothetical protein